MFIGNVEIHSRLALAPMAGGAVMEHFGAQAMFGSYMLPLVLGMGLYMIFTRTKGKGVEC